MRRHTNFYVHLDARGIGGVDCNDRVCFLRIDSDFLHHLHIVRAVCNQIYAVMNECKIHAKAELIYQKRNRASSAIDEPSDALQSGGRFVKGI